MKLAINASRARSGGAKAHLIGLLAAADPRSFGFESVHVWSYRELLNDLPSVSWLIKHAPAATEQSLARQLWWERFILPIELRNQSCELLLNVDAGTVSRFEPSVTMSRDMLAFEPGEARRLGIGKARLRQWLLRGIQCRSLTHSRGVIFLTRYASSVIQCTCGRANLSRIIPHGVGVDFRKHSPKPQTHDSYKGSVRLLYVSPVWPFKHQWNVVRAAHLLRSRGYPIHLTLVGSGSPTSLKHLYQQIQESDPHNEFISYLGPLPHSQIPLEMTQSDIFIFASSCENMPNTLVEAMSIGLPIACSKRGPMPEVLQDGGVYFDPEDPSSIADNVMILLNDCSLREYVAQRAYRLSLQYSWRRCATETFDFLAEVAASC